MIGVRYRWLAGTLFVLLAGCGTLPPSGGTRTHATMTSPPVVTRPAPPPAVSAPPSATPQTVPPVTVEAPPSAAETPAPPPTVMTPQSPAVVALLDNAGRQEKSGKLEAAAAVLERALRVDPRNPFVWHRLARVRLAQGQWQSAANMATKSNSLAAGDADLQRLNWGVIAEARQHMGDSPGARAARAHADK